MTALEKYRSEMLYAMGGDNRYHIDPRTAIELADAAIAELEAALANMTAERDAFRSCIVAGMAGCPVPAAVTEDLTDTGDCDKCRSSIRGLCHEYQTLARAEGKKP